MRGNECLGLIRTPPSQTSWILLRRHPHIRFGLNHAGVLHTFAGTPNGQWEASDSGWERVEFRESFRHSSLATATTLTSNRRGTIGASAPTASGVIFALIGENTQRAFGVA